MAIPREPESEAERARRHEASIQAYRTLVDPANPPRKPHLFEHHFFGPEAADVTGFTDELERNNYRIDTFAYDPQSQHRTWTVIALKLDLMEERRILTVSDELEALARRFGVIYDGWLTRVE